MVKTEDARAVSLPALHRQVRRVPSPSAKPIIRIEAMNEQQSSSSKQHSTDSMSIRLSIRLTDRLSVSQSVSSRTTKQEQGQEGKGDNDEEIRGSATKMQSRFEAAGRALTP